MVEVVGTVLASVSLFLEILDTCDRLYQGCKSLGRFGDDFRDIQSILNLQWRRFYYLVQDKRIPSSRLEGDSLKRADREVIQETLRRIERHFEACNRLIARYTGQRENVVTQQSAVSRAVLEPNAVPTSENSSTLVGSSEAGTESHSTIRSAELSHRKHHNPFHSRRLPWNRKKGSPGASGDNEVGPAQRVSVSESTTSRTATPDLAGDGDHLPYEGEAAGGMRTLWRVQWLRHDFDTLKDEVQGIRDGNNDLDKFFGQVALPNQTMLLEKFDEARRMWPLVDTLRKILSNLHQDLMRINPGEFDLSVQLLQDQKSMRRGLARHPALPEHLRDNSYVFMVQRHADAEVEPLLFECLPVAGPGQRNAVGKGLHSLENLRRPAEVESIGKVDLWGAIHASNSMQQDHVVFNARDVRWTKVASLYDILAGEEYREQMLPTQIAQLARLIVSAHLCFEDVRESCMSPRPENYYFYQPAGLSQAWNKSKPLALSPWLAFGFGKQKDPPIIGVDTGDDDPVGNAMVELGLLLFQVACGRPIDYGSGSLGLSQAKEKAIRDLQMVRVRVSSAFANMIQGLLERDTVPSHLRAEEHDDDDRTFIRDVLSALHKLERDLEGTLATPLLTSGSREQEFAVVSEAPKAVEEDQDTVKTPVREQTASGGGNDGKEESSTKRQKVDITASEKVLESGTVQSILVGT